MTKMTQMTQMTQRQDSAQGVPSQSRNALDTSNISSSCLSTTDSASDNDTSERPVREKLKKTSIASMPKNELIDHRNSLNAGNNDPNILKDSDIRKNSTETYTKSRGRPLRKRSFDDLEAAEGDAVMTEQHPKRSGGHARKRSRDVRVGEGFEGENRKIAAEITVQQVDQHDNIAKEFVELDHNHPPGNVASLSDEIVTHQDARDSTLSPRRKRSREQVDPDTHREQKIPATDQAKARRSSEENDRDMISQSLNSNATSVTHIKSDRKLAGSENPRNTDEVPVALSVFFHEYP